MIKKIFCNLIILFILFIYSHSWLNEKGLHDPHYSLKNLETLQIYKQNGTLQKLYQLNPDENFYYKLKEAIDVLPENLTCSNILSGKYLKLSSECHEDFLYVCSIFKNIKNLNEITSLLGTGVLSMIDATGINGPGILRGNFLAIGLRTECQNINVKIPGRDRPLTADLAKMIKDLNSSTYTFGQKCSTGSIKIYKDVCIPSTCANYNDFYQLAVLVDRLWGHDTTAVCGVGVLNDKAVVNYQGIITYSIIGIMFSISILISLWELWILPYHKKLFYTKSLPIKFLRCFSLYTNVKGIFKIKSPPKKEGAPTTTIEPIHCMRFFSMFWVIMGHSTSVLVAVTNNPLDILDIVGDYGTQYLVNAFYSVDTFIFIGGLLMSFIWFKNFKKNKRRTNSFMAWVMIYIHRFLRISPAYYMTIALYTFIFTNTWIRNFPRYYAASFGENDPCVKNWWINMLYLQNFINVDNQCYIPTWYLATDFQIFLFTPLIIVPLAIKPLYGYIVSGIILLISTISNLIIVYVYKFPPTDFAFGNREDITVPYWKYTMLIYNAPWVRCQVYIFGILVGYFLQMKKTLKINKIIVIILWIITLGSLAGIVLPVAKWSGGEYMNLSGRAFYSAFSKIVWSLGLSWIIIACYYGYGGIINKFMSMKIWIPLGKLSFCAYLLHYMVILYFYGMDQGPFFFTNVFTTFCNVIIPVAAISYFLAIFWSAVFEIGTANMITLALTPPRKPQKSKEELPSSVKIKNNNDLSSNKNDNEEKKDVIPHKHSLVKEIILEDDNNYQIKFTSKLDPQKVEQILSYFIDNEKIDEKKNL
ncbi:Acyltransferase 3 domain-containing protein [Strongyloides ratti]|uniref:Acyltransferase 3 domain-containing protein n=1 Tax=Strongyloides ratti TaxID=34506 RepID=A0A090LLE1_STRRB|nr:Acyltransferase 3 domain-containing protein [Strongyloides ratti]CEF70535.1 Acyltransferase 3 domain-containing protein [Strongyloides ratti]